MVLTFDFQSTIDQRLHHLVADIHHLIDRRAGEVTLLVSDLVTKVRQFFAPAIPFGFNAVDVKEAGIRPLIVAHVIEDEKFRFRSEVSSIRNACTIQISHCFSRDVSRITTVVFMRDRVDDVTNNV